MRNQIVKRIASVLLAGVMVVSLAACGGNKKTEEKAADDSKKSSKKGGSIQNVDVCFRIWGRMNYIELRNRKLYMRK